MPRFSPKSSTVSSFPSSMPVTLARSLFSSYDFILSTMSAGRFFSPVSRSPPMNSRPSSNNFFTCLPFMVMVPSSSIFAPGSFFTSSSITDPSATLYAAALYTNVSSCTTTLGTLAVITASPRSVTLSDNPIFPTSAFLPDSTVTLRIISLYPMLDTFRI